MHGLSFTIGLQLRYNTPMIDKCTTLPGHVSDYEEAKFESFSMLERQCQYVRAICSKKDASV